MLSKASKTKNIPRSLLEMFRFRPKSKSRAFKKVSPLGTLAQVKLSAPAYRRQPKGVASN
jgi:hypothetical protein